MPPRAQGEAKARPPPLAKVAALERSTPGIFDGVFLSKRLRTAAWSDPSPW